MKLAAGALNAVFDVVGLADKSLFYGLLNDSEIAVPTAVLVNGEKLSRFLRNGNYLFKLCRIHGYGLFADHVLSRLHCGNAIPGMEIVGNRNRYHVYPGDREQLFKSFTGNKPVFLRKIKPFLSYVEGGNNLKPLDRFVNAFVMPFRHSAVSDKSKLMCHFFSPFFT